MKSASVFASPSLKALALLGVLACPVALLAEDERATKVLEVAEEPIGPAEPVGSALSLHVGSDVATAYYFRGILQENQGVIVQPYGDLSVELYADDQAGFLRSAALVAGLWNSFHTEQTGATGSGPDAWYEADLYAGLNLEVSEGLTASLFYTAYTSPNGAFSTVQEVSLGLGYNDSGWWRHAPHSPGFGGLQPSMLVAFEVDNSAFGPEEGIYLQLGIEPSFPLAGEKLVLSLPVTVGLSLDDYYESATEDETFGYLDAGVMLSAPLSMFTDRFGAWTVQAGVHFLFLGHNMEAANNGDDFETIGTLGFSLDF